MEKVVHPYDKERMRLAMLKHEETFRQQVHELHRLYRIQKMLMNSVSHGPTQSQQKQNNTFFNAHQIHHQQQQHQQINGGDHANSKHNIMITPALVNRPDEQIVNNMIKSNGNMLFDENEIELTLSLGPSSAHDPRQIKKDGSESGLTHSSSSSGSNQSRKTSPNNNDNNNNNNNNNNKLSTWGSNNIAQGYETQPGFTNGQKNNPPWQYHALSLKLT